MKYQFIKDHQDAHRITVLCEALDIKRSSYYDWRSRQQSHRDAENSALLNKIRAIHKASRESAGAIKTWKQLRASGERCGLHHVERLRRKHGIEAKRMKLFRAANSGRNTEKVADNILNSQFDVKQPDRVWVGDITFITTRKGVLFLSTIIDLYSRQVVGWSMSHKSVIQTAITKHTVKAFIVSILPGTAGVDAQTDKVYC